MDGLDRKILALVQSDSRITIQELAERTGASTASVQRRLRAMREAGTIKREVALLDQQALGLGITAVVSVDLERDSVEQTETFTRKPKHDPHVTNFYCIAGDSDFVMIVVAKNIQDYEAFTQRFFFADKNVRKFRTSIVVCTVKATLEMPL
jgi:DNA-binding Lrp family transcriptional regulator